MKIKQFIAVPFLLLCFILNTGAQAQVESTWYGSFNTGVRFFSTPVTDSKDLEVYNDQGSFIGLDAYSGYPTFYVEAV